MQKKVKLFPTPLFNVFINDSPYMETTRPISIYSRTSRKRLPKMSSLAGRLRKVVA